MRKIIIPVFFVCLHYCAGSQKISQPVALLPQGEIWKDTEGNFINAHGAGMLHYKDTWYLYGEIKRGKTWLVPGQNWEDYRVPAGGVSCYSSKDLVHWKNEGTVLSTVKGQPGNDLDTGRVVERPKVIYNDSTKKFVMWMHIDTKDYAYARAGVAVSDKPTGPFTYLNSVRPNNQMARDMTLFKDDDGKAYLVYASENNETMQVCLLSGDYLSPTTSYSRMLIGENREAPAMFKYDNRYYLVTSLCTGWSPNAASYSVAENIFGPWKTIGNPCAGRDADSTFHSQGTYIFPLNEKKGEFIFMADQWNKTNLKDSRYLWRPLKAGSNNLVLITK